MKRLLLPLLLAALIPASASAEALLRLTPTGWSPDAWDAAGNPTGPVPIDGDGFRLTFHGGGTQSLVDPVLLILGIPTGAPPAIAQSGSSGGFPYDPEVENSPVSPGGSQVYGGNWAANGSGGVFNSSAGNQSVYEFLGLDDPNGGGADSESYTNWNGATGITSWNLWVYQLTFNPDFSRGDWVEFTNSLSLANGPYVVGYGLEPPKQNGKQDVQATPFTFAGRVTTQVPEPATLSLLIPGLALLAAKRRRARKQ